jgi:hypothetical protein
VNNQLKTSQARVTQLETEAAASAASAATTQPLPITGDPQLKLDPPAALAPAPADE